MERICKLEKRVFKLFNKLTGGVDGEKLEKYQLVEDCLEFLIEVNQIKIDFEIDSESDICFNDIIEMYLEIKERSDKFFINVV